MGMEIFIRESIGSYHYKKSEIYQAIKKRLSSVKMVSCFDTQSEVISVRPPVIKE